VIASDRRSEERPRSVLIRLANFLGTPVSEWPKRRKTLGLETVPGRIISPDDDPAEGHPSRALRPEEMRILLFAYIGPETLLPMTSVLAAAVGFAAMFGRNVFVLASKIFRSILSFSRRLKGSSASTLPRYSRQDQRQGGWRGPRATSSEAFVDATPKGTQPSQTSC
jgi:hypothetical protein